MQNLLEIADYYHFDVSQVIANQFDTFAFGSFVVRSIKQCSSAAARQTRLSTTTYFNSI